MIGIGTILDHPLIVILIASSSSDRAGEIIAAWGPRRGPARGNVTEVKVVLASVVATLAVYQAVLMSIGYGKLRPPFLGSGPASSAHPRSAMRSSSSPSWWR